MAPTQRGLPQELIDRVVDDLITDMETSLDLVSMQNFKDAILQLRLLSKQFNYAFVNWIFAGRPARVVFAPRLQTIQTGEPMHTKIHYLIASHNLFRCNGISIDFILRATGPAHASKMVERICRLSKRSEQVSKARMAICLPKKHPGDKTKYSTFNNGVKALATMGPRLIHRLAVREGREIEVRICRTYMHPQSSEIVSWMM